MRTYRFHHVDVFTDRVFGGNQLAVFPDGTGLSDREMQAIAQELNLAETTFVLPSTRTDCAARVRIFTPARELPVAGHPTLGTAYVLATHGLLPGSPAQFALEEGIGPVAVTTEGDPTAPTTVWMRQATPTFVAPGGDRVAFSRMLGLEPDDLRDGAPIQVGDMGIRFVYVPLRDPAAVDRAELDAGAFARLVDPERVVGAFVFAVEPPADARRVYSRMFAPLSGVREDPATGSASGPLGAYLVRHGLVTADDGAAEIVSEQGVKMGRPSRVRIRVARGGAEIAVGGGVVPVLDGVLTLP